MEANLYDRIAERLANPNGAVQITTMTRSVLYRSKHAGLFVKPRTEQEQAHGVYVRRGKALEFVDERMVDVRFGTFR